MKNKLNKPINTIFLNLLLTGALVGCSTVTPNILTNQHFQLVLTVQTQPNDTKANLEAQYQGKISVWRPEAGFAILGVNQTPQSSQNVIGVDQNTDVVDAPEARQLRTGVGYEGWSVMGTGLSAWAGGWSSWASGWSVVGSGTSSLPTLPSANRFSFTQISLPTAQTLSRNYGSGMKVAVIDTGLDLAHPAFVGHLAPSAEWKDYVDGDATPQDISGGVGYGHGTGIAGIILQVAPKVSILPIRVLDSNGAGDLLNVISAIDWAVLKGANIINLSLGTNVDVTALKTEVDYAGSKGVYVVAASGNAGATTMTYPAEYAKSITNAKYLISVGSTASTSLVSIFTNVSPNLELLAPAQNVTSAYPNNRTGYFTGTSFAVPQVVGALALTLADTALANRGNGETYLYTWAGSGTGTVGRQISVVNAIRQTPDWQARKALFIVGNATTLSVGDTTIQTVLWNLGYTVTLKVGASSSAADATGKDLIVISSSVKDSDVNTKFRSVATPVLVWKSSLYSSMGMVATSADQGEQKLVSGISMLNVPHPLSAGVSAGTWTVFNTADTMTWGKPNSNAIKVATLTTDPTKAVIFAYDKGVQMTGLVAPARRVAFMFKDASETNATTHWLSNFLIISAVNWAVSGN